MFQCLEDDVRNGDRCKYNNIGALHRISDQKIVLDNNKLRLYYLYAVIFMEEKNHENFGPF